MPLTVLCPHCRQAVSIKRLPVDTCPACAQPFPEDFARAVESQFRPERPLGLTAQIWLGYFAGFLALLTIPSSFQPMDLSALRLLELGVPPTPPPVPFGLLTVAQTLLLFWSSWAIQKDQFRSRLLLVWLLLTLVCDLLLILPWIKGPSIAQFLFMDVGAAVVICTAGGLWYLYRARKVVAYYEALRHQESVRTPPPLPGRV